MIATRQITLDLTKNCSIAINKKTLSNESVQVLKGGDIMEGYTIPIGYMGLTHNGWMLFETEEAYYEYMTS